MPWINGKQYGSKRDHNHRTIVRAFVACGASVMEADCVGGGAPDLVVGLYGENFLVEVKNLKSSYGKRGLNKNQQSFKRRWGGGEVFVATSIEDVQNLMKAWRAK